MYKMTHTVFWIVLCQPFFLNKVILIIVITVVHSKYRLHKDFYLTHRTNKVTRSVIIIRLNNYLLRCIINWLNTGIFTNM